MSFILVLGTAFALALDAFAVSVGISSAFPLLAKRNMYRVALHFGLFQFGMPIAGWLAGNSIQDYIRSFSHWIAFGLLLFIGGKMIFESFDHRKCKTQGQADPTRGYYLVLLSVATSIDALAVGLSLAFLDVGIIYPAVIIGVVAFAMTVLGIRAGAQLGRLAKRGGEVIGGMVLIVIGIVIIL